MRAVVRIGERFSQNQSDPSKGQQEELHAR